jgi:hypothetical protein
LIADRTCVRLTVNGVDLKRVPPKSRPTAIRAKQALWASRAWKAARRTPPSTFLFLPIHMSNSPEAEPPLSDGSESRRSLKPPTWNRTLVTEYSVRSFGGAPSADKAASASPCWRYIGWAFRPCQHPDSRNRHGATNRAAAGPVETSGAPSNLAMAIGLFCSAYVRLRTSTKAGAPLRPHSKGVL